MPQTISENIPATRSLSVQNSFALVLKGGTWVLAGLVFARILEFFARTLLARELGPDGFGIINTSLGLLSVIGTFALLGLPSGIVKFIGQYDDTERDIKADIASAAFWFVSIVGIIIGGLGIVFRESISYLLLGNSESESIVVNISLAIPIFIIQSIILSIYQSYKDARSYSLINSIALPSIRLIGVAIAIALGSSINGIIFVFLSGALFITNFLAFILLQKHSINILRVRTNFFSIVKQLLKFSIPLLVGSLFALAVWQLDVIILQRSWGAYDAGLYSAALTLGRLPNIILLAFGFMVSPIAANQYREGKIIELQTLYGRTINLIIFLGLPIVAFLLINSQSLLSTLFGKEYGSVSTVFNLIVIGYFFHSILGPNGNTLVMIGKSRLYLIDTAIAAILSIILYLLMIPNYGIMGATIATLAGLTVLNLIFSLQLYQFTKINPLKWARTKIILVALLSVVLTMILTNFLAKYLADSSEIFSLLIQAGVLGVIYIIFSAVFKLFTWKDILLITRGSELV